MGYECRRETIILSWGTPKSGTTFIKYMVQEGHSFYYQRIREGMPFHLRHGKEQFLQLLRLFRDDVVILVRTIRHPVDIIEAQFTIHPERTKSEQELRTAIDFYRAESEATAEAWRILRDESFHREYKYVPAVISYVPIRYEELSNTRACRKILELLTQHMPDSDGNKRVFEQYIGKMWNKRPVRDGRMYRKQKGDQVERQLSNEQIQLILSELSDVIEYENVHSDFLQEIGWNE